MASAPDESEDAKSVLFLSCDIVGSTHYKQKSTAIWQRTFLSFYREFPQALAVECEKQDGFKGEIRLWKAVGDELIFRASVSKEEDVYKAVRSWLAAMRAYEVSTLAEEKLSTKGGAFIATFPGPDSESSIPIDPRSEDSVRDVVDLNHEALAQRDSSKYLYDYFGPSIDTGFRVFGMASRRNFSLSVEVAWAMCDLSAAQRVVHHEYPMDDLVFLGTHALKGVWDSREYPVFALDREAQDGVNLALKALGEIKFEPAAVAKLCQECCMSADWPSSLYLPDSSRPEFRSVPVDPLKREAARDIQGFETVPPVQEQSGTASESELIDVAWDKIEGNAPVLESSSEQAEEKK